MSGERRARRGDGTISAENASETGNRKDADALAKLQVARGC